MNPMSEKHVKSTHENYTKYSDSDQPNYIIVPI